MKIILRIGEKLVVKEDGKSKVKVIRIYALIVLLLAM